MHNNEKVNTRGKLDQMWRVFVAIIFVFGTLHGVNTPMRSAPQEPCCVLPTDEYSVVAGRVLYTISQFDTEISDPYGTVFDDRHVSESSWAPGTNTCYFEGNDINMPEEPMIPSPGGQWWVAEGEVWQQNHYGFDYIGVGPTDAVRYIQIEVPARGMPMACTWTVYQLMSMDCSSLPNTYAFNILTVDIDVTTVTNCRHTNASNQCDYFGFN